MSLERSIFYLFGEIGTAYPLDLIKQCRLKTALVEKSDLLALQRPVHDRTKVSPGTTLKKIYTEKTPLEEGTTLGRKTSIEPTALTMFANLWNRKEELRGIWSRGLFQLQILMKKVESLKLR